ncbi:heavy-metal-associated domain-containing protein [Entomospira culicis]|uniref:Heavy-metal-associated domain-containing protein n=1 Tax=Entomospira culicis TaxID=2719989 RepID=A0A968GE45_9SPIO|nr:cation transporter [Entomospira culicis]NIZ18659.1 heavy-metal-associated domain-containing protein [Entomospira culicis]NIZ68874.1 heavy-metal-associated domain-containing protein [Entomospira culicis]WDI37467.1 cation transporter [Entomospira culicis]WDI39095.1 cation transporter [Entomospira culicis]
MQEYKFNVSGMSCGHCKKRVEEAALALASVVHAEVNLEQGTLVIRSEDALEERLIIDAIDEAGYDAVMQK